MAAAQAPGLSSGPAFGFGLWRGRLFWPVEADWHFPAVTAAPLQRPTQAPISRASRRQDDDRPWRQSAALIQRAAAHRHQANGPQFAGRFGLPICGAKSLRAALKNQEIRINARNTRRSNPRQIGATERNRALLRVRDAAGYDLNRPTFAQRAFRATAMHSRILVLTHPKREATLRANNNSTST